MSLDICFEDMISKYFYIILNGANLKIKIQMPYMN
jgi:hypothetical protein